MTKKSERKKERRDKILFIIISQKVNEQFK